MVEILLGIAAGSLVAAFINHTYNTSVWISTKYLVIISVAALLLAILGNPAN